VAYFHQWRTGRGVGETDTPCLEKFHGELCFQGERKLLKNLNDKKYMFSTVNSGQTVFRATASCSKILNDQKYFNTMKNCRAALFFRHVELAQKS